MGIRGGICPFSNMFSVRTVICNFLAISILDSLFFSRNVLKFLENTSNSLSYFKKTPPF